MTCKTKIKKQKKRNNKNKNKINYTVVMVPLDLDGPVVGRINYRSPPTVFGRREMNMRVKTQQQDMLDLASCLIFFVNYYMCSLLPPGVE